MRISSETCRLSTQVMLTQLAVRHIMAAAGSTSINIICEKVAFQVSSDVLAQQAAFPADSHTGIMVSQQHGEGQHFSIRRSLCPCSAKCTPPTMGHTPILAGDADMTISVRHASLANQAC